MTAFRHYVDAPINITLPSVDDKTKHQPNVPGMSGMPQKTTSVYNRSVPADNTRSQLYRINCTSNFYTNHPHPPIAVRHDIDHIMKTKQHH